MIQIFIMTPLKKNNSHDIRYIVYIYPLSKFAQKFTQIHRSSRSIGHISITRLAKVNARRVLIDTYSKGRNEFARSTRSVARITATDSFSSRIDRRLVNASTTTELITTATGHVTRGSGACENLLAIFSVLRQLSLWCNCTKVDRVCRSRLNGNL